MLRWRKNKEGDMRAAQLSARGILILFLAACASETVPSSDEVALKKPVGGGDPSPTGARECDPKNLISYVPRSPSCCRDDSGDWFMAPRPQFVGWLVHHELGTPCTGTTVDHTAACSGTACYYGPCGGTRPQLYQPLGHVFKSSSDPTVCGRQAGNLAGFPEPFVGQEAWAGVMGTCPFTDCLGSDPAVGLTVQAIADAATGNVKSIPKGIFLRGGGVSKWFFTQADVKLSAEPADSHARAVFSGDCVATGAYGEDGECKLNLAGGKTVTVTYECEPGYSCL
jgi:hypothetical protein